ncbi:hypothetical protein [Streptomyces sp. 8L]|uniref:hypothetical protein n=1 Tax=Streptomyces sp. 8L TaxID=2877242 RepID=UPI001CD43B69|nr:hypothetical protein [Streptomyces sp. 8L]MCA1224040.1 hypothetical protein [Streptomyces sp. 8L]
MPYWEIAKRVGLAQESSLQHLMWGRGDYGPGRQVRRETAEVILAYWPSLSDFPDGARIDATGTRRRMEALAVRGWPSRLMAEQVGMLPQSFRKACNRDRVTARVARGVAAMYDAWWNQDPLDHGVSLYSVSRVQAEAMRMGFCSALAWDDDTIDDPDAEPEVAPVASAKPTEGSNVVARWLMGESVILDREGRRAAIVHLMEWTDLTPAQVGERLDTSAEAVSRAWERAKKKARDEEGRRLWRRVYIPLSERGLTRDEMESAA